MNEKIYRIEVFYPDGRMETYTSAKYPEITDAGLKFTTYEGKLVMTNLRYYIGEMVG